MSRRVVALLLLFALLGTPIALADHPTPLPDTINTPNFSYVVNYTNNNPYDPNAPTPSDDQNYFPTSQAQHIADALNNSDAATPGAPNGHHNGFVNLSFLAPDFGGTPRNVEVNDCSAHDGCDMGSAPADKIRMPAPAYVDASEACIRLVIGHELFHHVQYSYITFGQWQAWGRVPVEGTARLMQDKIYSDLDANAGCITYQGQANALLGNPNQTLWDLSYTSALFWNYLTEQFGSTSAEPQRGVDVIRRFWEHAQDNNDSPDLVGTMRQTIADYDSSTTLEKVFHDFTIANYTKGLDVSALDEAIKYRYRDENYTTGDTYDPVTTALSATVPPTIGPSNSSVVRWGAQYYQADVDISQCRSGVVGFRSTGQQAAYSLLAIKGAAHDKVDRLYKNVTSTFARALMQRVGDPYTRLTAVVAGLNDPANFSYTFACGQPKLTILEPTATRVAYVGEKNAPDRFLIRLSVTGPTELGDPSVEGLDPSDFTAFVGDPSVAANQATIISGAYVQGQYWLVAQAPTKVPADPALHNLTVRLGTTPSATQEASVRYERLKFDQVLVIDRSGSMLDPASSPKIVAARNAATLFVDAARDNDKIGVVSFSGNNSEPDDDATLNRQLQNITAAQRNAAKAAIQAIAASGFTSIGDGLRKGADEIAVRGSAVIDGVPAEKWLVLLSDGMQNEALLYADPLVRQRLLDDGIKVNTIALGPLTDQALLQQIASDTGGVYSYVDVGPGTLSAGADSPLSTGPLANQLGDAFAIANERIQRHVRLWEDRGTVGGAPVVRVIPISGGGIGDAMFSFNWSRDTDRLGVQIKRPNGTIVAPGDPGVQIISTNTHTVIRVGTLSAGNWTVTLTATSGAPEYLGILSGRDQQGARLDLAFGQWPGSGYSGPGLFWRGLPMPILASLTDKQGPIGDAKVLAQVEHPDGSVITLPLFDDGNHSDGQASDGVYGNNYTRTTIASPTGLNDSTAVAVRGSYNVRIDATGQDNANASFSRITKGSFQVREGARRSEQDPDPDKDGYPTRYEVLHPCLKPAVNDASADPDQDGLTNLDEWRAGSDPCHPDTDRGGEADRSELARNANLFDPTDDKLPAPVDVEVIDWQLDHVPFEAGQEPQSKSNLIRYPVHPSYNRVRLLRSTNANGPFTAVATIDPSVNGGVYRDPNLVNGVTYYYKVEALDLNGNASAPSHVFSGMPKADSLAPRGHVTIAGGAAYVRTSAVVLDLTEADPDVTAVQLSNQANFAGAVWQTYGITKTWTLAPGAGQRTVFARFRDAAGNQSDTYYDSTIVKSPLLSLGNIIGRIRLVPLLAPPASTLAVGLAGATVEVLENPNITPDITSAGGNFRLVDVPAGRYTLRIWQTGYAPRLVSVTVQGDQTADLGLQSLRPYGVFAPIMRR